MHLQIPPPEGRRSQQQEVKPQGDGGAGWIRAARDGPLDRRGPGEPAPCLGRLCTFPWHVQPQLRAPLFFLSCLFPLLLSSCLFPFSFPGQTGRCVPSGHFPLLSLSFLISAVVHFSYLGTWGPQCKANLSPAQPSPTHFTTTPGGRRSRLRQNGGPLL